MHAMPTVTFYFDPISPYAWLASKQIDRIEAAGARVLLQPVLFAGLLDAHGHKGPAEIAAKRIYTFTDVMRQAAQQGLRFEGPPGHPFNPLLTLRMALALDDPASRRRFACAAMAACWECGADLSASATMVALADDCGVDGEALALAASEAPLKQRLVDATREAIDAGVFGVPTFRVDDALFWGGDRIDALLWHLGGNRIDAGALARFLDRPASANRNVK